MWSLATPPTILLSPVTTDGKDGNGSSVLPEKLSLEKMSTNLSRFALPVKIQLMSSSQPCRTEHFLYE